MQLAREVPPFAIVRPTLTLSMNTIPAVLPKSQALVYRGINTREVNRLPYSNSHIDPKSLLPLTL